MRISHSHKFVFLATPKTGSTTVRNILDRYSDIRSVHITETTNDFPFYHHISASELRDIFQVRGWDWDNYQKFCFVRNPYDRVVSLYHHIMRIRELKNPTASKLSFRNFVMNIDPTSRVPTTLESFLCDQNGKLLVNEILVFEELTHVLPVYLNKLGISINSEDIPHLNASHKRLGYRDYYDDELKKSVRNLYKYEFERFEYSF